MLDIVKLKKILSDKKMQQKTLARKAGVDPNQISHWITGRHKPTTFSMRKMADALEVEMSEIMVTPPSHEERYAVFLGRLEDELMKEEPNESLVRTLSEAINKLFRPVEAHPNDTPQSTGHSVKLTFGE